MIEKFRGFQIGDRIGSGGMSSIYQGVQTALDRKVAVKVLHPALGDDEQFIQRFEREAKSASSLGHPNVVNIIDFGSESGAYFIVMELVEGHDLRWYFRKCPHMPPEMTLIFLEEICHGLEAAHAKNIVHRDIKPSNVLLSNDGRLAIADFGLARQVGDLERFSAITATGAVLGTPAYMSPEQLAGEDLDHRTDIYSLGVMAYEFFVGERPFKSTTSGVRTADKIMQGSFPPMERNGIPLPPDLVHLVSRMLALDPERRFPTVSGVIDAVQNAMERIDTTGRLLKQRKHYLRRFAQDPVGFSAELLGVEDDPTQFASAQILSGVNSGVEEPISYETVPSMDTQPSRDESAGVSASDGGGASAESSGPSSSGSLDSVSSPSGPSAVSPDDVPGSAATAPTDSRGATADLSAPEKAQARPNRAAWAVPLALSCLILIVMAVPRFLPSGSADSVEAGGATEGLQPSGSQHPDPSNTHVNSVGDMPGAATNPSSTPGEFATRDSRQDDGGSEDGRMTNGEASPTGKRSAADPTAADVSKKETAAPQPSAGKHAGETAAAREKVESEPTAEPAAKEQAARDQAARDQAARDQAAREQAARDLAAKEQAARDLAAKEEAAQAALNPTGTKSRQPGTIEVRVIPPADVYIDGKLVATKSRFVQHSATPNSDHVVEVRHSSFGDHRWSANPAAGDTTRLVHRFHWGDVRIGWLPAGQADVYFDDLLAGGVNGFARQVSLGEHRVRVRRNGYRIRSVELTDANGTRLLDGPGAAGVFPQYLVDVTSGSTVTVNFLFEKE